MSHVTITTTISQGNPSDKPHVDVLVNDNNRQNDLTTHKPIDSSHTGTSLLSNTNTHNISSSNDYQNTQGTHDANIHRSHDYDNTHHTNLTNVLPQTHTNSSTTTHTQDVNINRSHDYDQNRHNTNVSNVLPQTHTTTTTTSHPQDNVGLHSHSHEYDNLHGKDKDITSPLLGTNTTHNVGSGNTGSHNVGLTNVNKNIEVDSNRKDNWETPDNLKTGVNNTEHHRHNNDVLTSSNDSHLKKDHGHHHLHDTNYKSNTTGTDIYSHPHDTNKTSSHHQNPLMTTDKTNKTDNTVIVDNDLNKRNLTYDTNPTFANDVGTTGLLGNNLGNNLARDAGPDNLVPRGINRNADWTGHVPDASHPKHDDLEHLPKDNKKL